MSTDAVSPLRQRMIEDMNARKLCAGTQRGHINNASRSEVRPEQFERRARLVSAVARGRRWLDDVISGRVTTVAELCAREKCSVRQVNMTISLAFLAPNLVKAALEGRLPRGIGVERLRDPPTEWSRQFEALGLNPE